MDSYEEIQNLMATIENTKEKIANLESIYKCNTLERFQKRYDLVIEHDDLLEMYKGLFSLALQNEHLKLETLMSQFTKLIK